MVGTRLYVVVMVDVRLCGVTVFASLFAIMVVIGCVRKVLGATATSIN